MSAIRQRLAKPGWYRVAFTPLTVRSGALLQLKEGIDISLPAGGTPHPSGGRAANGCAAECLHQRHQSLATPPKAVGSKYFCHVQKVNCPVEAREDARGRAAAKINRTEKSIHRNEEKDMKYDFASIEKKWQQKWLEEKPFTAVTGLSLIHI